MRVVLVGTAYPMRGGIAHYVALLFQKMKEKGHDISVLSFYQQYPKFLFPGKTQMDEGEELFPVDSHALLDSINPFSWIKAFFWIKQYRPDCLVFKYWMPFFAPCYATLIFLSKRFLKIPSIYICDNITPHEQHVLNRVLSWLGLLFVDGYIVQSKAVEEDLLVKKKHPQYSFVPHPIYEIFPRAISKESAKAKLGIQEKEVLLYFGFIRKYKGLKYIIQAMPEILKKRDVHLIICGEFYEGRDETFQLIRENNLSDKITVADDFIPNEEVHYYFCASDLVVLPYISATQSGIVQMAYYYDRPVLATDVGGLPEVVLHDKTGFIVPPENQEAITESVLKYYDQELENNFIKNIKEEKKKYSWDRMTEAIENLYQKIRN